ncbi:hypothetical protein AB0M39_40125 [Streptomyces sp. NPDC051907]|uniref:hypothetical protein n=1 Tax=Streptomyces sp. NPDC051907 TaxID=3155284 RepID=UPI00342B2E80
MKQDDSILGATDDELAERMSTGGVLEARLHRGLTFGVSIAGVDAWVRLPVEPGRIADLNEGLAADKIDLVIPLPEDVLGGQQETDVEEMELLKRLLAVRARLIGKH